MKTTLPEPPPAVNLERLEAEFLAGLEDWRELRLNRTQLACLVFAAQAAAARPDAGPWVAAVLRDLSTTPTASSTPTDTQQAEGASR